MTRSVTPSATDFPTLGLILLTYGAFGALTWFHAALPWWLLAPLGGILVCLHGSLQHEAVHGFPFRAKWANTLLLLPPLSLWMPYTTYRDTHLAHHRDENLTLPGTDPESFYVNAAQWQRLPRWYRVVLEANNSLLGRLLIGPVIVTVTTFVQGMRSLRAGDPLAIRDWSLYAAGIAILAIWVIGICGMNPLIYVLCFAYPGASLTLLRSFAEHRASDDPAARTAIVKPGWFFGLLFLFNSYHVVHHNDPSLPWYRRSARFREQRDAIVAANGGYVFRGYGAIARQFLLRRKEAVIHPLAQRI
jgi:fatty acid desaturase